jgi:hypothetical protein
VILTRFDLWPTALLVLGLAAVLAERRRPGLGVLGVAASAKIFPAVVVPLALTYVWRRRGRREALVCAGIFAAVVALCFAPFVRLSPGGVWDSLYRQADRPLQIESLGSSFLLVAHQLGLWTVQLNLSHGSQNQGGSLADTLAAIQSVVQALVVIALWVAFARGPATPERLVRYSAACVAAFIAFGKVLSPQFLIWLLPLVPLVRGRRGLAGLGRARRGTRADASSGSRTATGVWHWTRTRSPPGLFSRATSSSSRSSSSWLCLDANGSHDVAVTVRPALDEDTFDPDAALGGLEAHGHAGAHARDREVCLDTDHGVVWAGHAGVADRGRAAG